MTRSQPGAPDPPAPKQASVADGDDEARRRDQRLDEELDETFPARDPIPWRHDSNRTGANCSLRLARFILRERASEQSGEAAAGLSGSAESGQGERRTGGGCFVAESLSASLQAPHWATWRDGIRPRESERR